MSLVVLIPAMQRGAYEDLRLLVSSLRAYAPEVTIHVAYKGEVPPPRMFGVARVSQQPAEARHFGDACRFLVEDAGGHDHFVFLNDDCVVTPTTFPALYEDLGMLTEMAGDQLGLVGMRSNYIAGVQNIRRPATTDAVMRGFKWTSEGQILEVPTVFGVAFYVTRKALAATPPDWTQLHWYSDNLLSYDMRKLGYRHFVSRAYVHHHGSRSGTDYDTYDAEGRAWLQTNRPDFPLP
jgi:hypothetical protein